MKPVLLALSTAAILPVTALAEYEIPSEFREMSCIFQAGDVPDRTIRTVELRRVAGDVVWLEDGTSPLPVVAVVIAGDQTTVYAPTTLGPTMLTILPDGTARASRHWLGPPDRIPWSALSGTCTTEN